MEEETKQCPNCGEAIKAEAKKCKFCGEWIKDESKDGPKNMHCPYCGEEILSVAKKCKHCGEWLEQETTSYSASSKTNNDPCLIAINIINFAMLGFSFVDASFENFFWSNFGAFCVWALISTGVASAIDKHLKDNKGIQK